MAWCSERIAYRSNFPFLVSAMDLSVLPYNGPSPSIGKVWCLNGNYFYLATGMLVQDCNIIGSPQVNHRSQPTSVLVPPDRLDIFTTDQRYTFPTGFTFDHFKRADI
jgi:hypothetical protein